MIPAVTGFALLGAGMALPLSPTALVAITAAGEGAEEEAAGIFNLARNSGRLLGLGTP